MGEITIPSPPIKTHKDPIRGKYKSLRGGAFNDDSQEVKRFIGPIMIPLRQDRIGVSVVCKAPHREFFTTRTYTIDI